MSFITRRITRMRIPGDRAIVWDENLQPFPLAAREMAVAIRGDGRTVLLVQSVIPGGRLEQLAAHLGAKAGYNTVLAEGRQERFLSVTDQPYEEYFAGLSSGTRDSFKYAQRRLAKFMDGDVRHERFERPEDVERFYALAEAVSRQTYQWQELGMGMKQREFVLPRLHLAARLGFLRCYVLFCRGEPVAFWESYSTGGVFLTYQTGYLPSLGKYSVGTVLTLAMLRDLLAGGGQRWTIDWLTGSSDYKKRLSTTTVEEHSLYLLPKRLEWMAFSASFAASNVLHSLGTRVKTWLQRRRVPAHWLGSSAPLIQLLDDTTWMTALC
jgi:GNAT acetyltransferase-like protein